jgi:TatD DNase family protein
MIDSHAHIYDEQFDADRQEVIQAALDKNVQKILMPNCNSETIEIMHQCAENFPGICIPMMGLHPCYVKDNFENELKIVWSWLEKRKDYCAIGEIGLDYYWDKTFISQQQKALHQQIELALHFKLPIVIHSRESTQECMDIIFPYISKGLQGVFHCYSGNAHQAKQLVEMNFYLGIGGVLTYKKSDLGQILQEIPLSNLILETDAPYLAPIPFRGKRNQPAFTQLVAQKLAELKKSTLEEIDQITTQNVNKLFRLNS